MNIFTKVTCLLSAVTMLIATNPVCASAEEFESDIRLDNAVVDMSEYHDYLDTLSDEQMEAALEKEALMNSLSMQNGAEIQAVTATKLSIPGTFTMYQQETDTYCGSACVKSLLMYVNGSSPTQSSINSSINNSFTAIPNYVNSRQSNCQYLLVTSPTQANLQTCVYMDITNDEVPTFLRLNGTSSPSWYYATNGHCVLSNAIYSDKSIIQIADPLGGRVSGCLYFYEKSASTVSSYTTHVCY